MRSTARWLASLAVGLATLSPVAATAHDDLPPGPIKDRHWMMEDLGDQVENINEAFDLGSEGFDTEVIQRAAGAIAMSAHRIPSLFPQGSTDPKSRALPAIWTNWDKFTALAKQLEDQAASLQKAAGAEDDENLKGKVNKLTATCKSCHDQFRKPPDKKK
ncbi:MAG: cytochrome c [Deltaproteobacteria bacterium]|nr:cytochrome c [Deltaproteobacteria bacterium]